MRLDVAEALAKRILLRFSAPVQGEGFIAGSIRRRKPEPKDIEIILPIVEIEQADGHAPIDVVHKAIRRHCILRGEDEAGDLFIDDDDRLPSDRWFSVIKGLKPGFRYAQLECDPFKAWPDWKQGQNILPFKVDIFRYDPAGIGHGGNFGWIMTIRTGPQQFGQDLLSFWKGYRGRRDVDGSFEGYLLDFDGQPIPTNTEASVFNLMSIRWVDPWDRVDRNQIVPTAQTIPDDVGVGPHLLCHQEAAS